SRAQCRPPSRGPGCCKRPGPRPPGKDARPLFRREDASRLPQWITPRKVRTARAVQRTEHECTPGPVPLERHRTGHHGPPERPLPTLAKGLPFTLREVEVPVRVRRRETVRERARGRLELRHARARRGLRLNGPPHHRADDPAPSPRRHVGRAGAHVQNELRRILQQHLGVLFSPGGHVGPTGLQLLHGGEREGFNFSHGPTSCHSVAADSRASRRVIMSLYCASVPKPSAPSAPGSPLSPLGPCAPSSPSAPAGPRAPSAPGSPLSPLSPLGPCAALAAPADSIRFSSAAVIGVPPASPSFHLSGSNAIKHHPS